MNKVARAAAIGFSIFVSVTAFVGVTGIGLYNSGVFSERERAAQFASELQRRESFRALVGGISSRPKTEQLPASPGTQDTREGDTASSSSGESYLQSVSDPSKKIIYQPSNQQAEPDRKKKQAVYKSLRETCNSWTRWYNQDRSAHSAANMNAACREAADYGRKELNLKTKAPNYVDLNKLSSKPAPSSGGAILIESNAPLQVSTRCRSIRAALERVQASLRAPHSVQKGNRLRERRRELWDQERQHCR